MRISVIGTGYVGLVTGTCLADYGNDVFCVDVVSEKIENLKKEEIILCDLIFISNFAARYESDSY